MTKSMGPIFSCNPCGEQFLHFSNSCNLGSIDVNKFFDVEHRLDWNRLREVTHLCTRFLDNVIDTCAWPLPEIKDVVHRTRPVGLGIMGFADLCLNLKITYGSPASIDLMDEVMGFPTTWAYGYSPFRPSGHGRAGSTFGMIGMNGSAGYADIDSGVAVGVMRNRFTAGDLTTITRIDELIEDELR